MTKQQSWTCLGTEPDVWEWTSTQPCFVIVRGHLIRIGATREGGLQIYAGIQKNQPDGHHVSHGHAIDLLGLRCSIEQGSLSLIREKESQAAPRPRSTGRRAASKDRGSSGGKK